MNIRHIECFLNVCKLGSVTLAAEEMGIAQPALSKRIHQLEHELGTKLFERHSRGVKPTNAGNLFRQGATEMIRRLEEIKNEVRESNNQVSGSVTLAVNSALAPDFATRLYPKFANDHPNLSLKIVDCPSHLVSESIRNLEADLAIVPNSALDLPNALSIPLFEENLHFVFAKNSGKYPSKMKFADAAAAPLVLPFLSYDLRKRLEQVARNKGVQLNVKYEAGSIGVISRLVADGIANSIVPMSYCTDMLQAGKIDARPISDLEIKRIHSLCWLSSRTEFPSTEFVKDTIISETEQMIKDGSISGKFLKGKVTS